MQRHRQGEAAPRLAHRRDPRCGAALLHGRRDRNRPPTSRARWEAELNFAAPAAELRQQEIARLRDALTPRLESLRSMTPTAFGAELAAMWERFGHAIINDPAARELVHTSKQGRKFVTAYAAPADP